MRRFSLLPLGCYLLLLAYAAYAASVVGHWPYYAHPDPKELPHRGLLHAAAMSMLTGALSLFLLPIGYATWRLVLRLKHRTVPTHRAWVVLYASGAVLWILDIAALWHGRLPWHSILNWILD